MTTSSNSLIKCALLLALVALCTLLPAQLQAQSINDETEAALSLDDYAMLLAEVESQLAQAVAGDLAAYDAAYSALLGVGGVRLAQQEIVRPKMLLLDRAQIAEAELPAHIAAAQAQVRLVRSQLAASARDSSAARLALLEQLLARPEFAQQESLLQRGQRWLSELWARLFPSAGGRMAQGAVRIGPLVFWSLVVIGGSALVYMLSYWLQGLFGRLVGDVEARRRAQQEGDLPLTAQRARAEAARLAQDGSYRQAVRQLYLAALLTLDERGVIQYERSLTNREVLTQVHGQQQVESHLLPVVETFDRVWYGEKEPDRALFDSYEREIGELAAAAEERAQSGAEKQGSRQ